MNSIKLVEIEGDLLKLNKVQLRVLDPSLLLWVGYCDRNPSLLLQPPLVVLLGLLLPLYHLLKVLIDKPQFQQLNILLGDLELMQRLTKPLNVNVLILLLPQQMLQDLLILILDHEGLVEFEEDKGCLVDDLVPIDEEALEDAVEELGGQGAAEEGDEPFGGEGKELDAVLFEGFEEVGGVFGHEFLEHPVLELGGGGVLVVPHYVPLGSD